MGYSFGKKWLHFLRWDLNEKACRKSQEGLLKLLCTDSLAGKVFMDIGCGSGLASLAALRSGAAKVVAWDYDPDSVAASMFLRKKFGYTEDQWSVQQGNVLSKEFVQSLPEVDIVYSWGVLHHTGDVWKALSHVDIPLKSDGILVVALYSYDVIEKPEYWLEIKQEYNRAGLVKRFWLECAYLWRHVGLRNTYKLYRTKKKQRGMHLWMDICDWLGGWPKEYVWDKDVMEFFEKKGYKLKKMITGEANTEFCFQRCGE